MSSPTIKLEHQYCAHNYSPLPVVLVRGEGVHVWDEAGKCYIDMMSAYSAVSHGHCHPRLVACMHAQSQRLGVVSRAYYTDQLGPFLKKACELTGMARALPMNTGAEAVETGLKAARKWAYTKKGVPLDQAEIIVCDGNFHGRTIAIVGLSSEAQYKHGFGPFPRGGVSISFADTDALEKAITPNTAAFLVEPIQGEGGIILPPPGYLKACEVICRRNNVLLICDEVQCGLGRTGRLVASHHDAVQPDGLILGKALGGGVLPVSLFLSSSEVMDVFTPGDHGSTFGGYPLAAAVGLESLTIIEEDNYAQRAAQMGKKMIDALRAIHCPAVSDVRGQGLLVGVELKRGGVSAHDVCLELMREGLLSKDTHETVIRFAPPLIISEEECDAACHIVKTVFNQL